MPSPSEPSPSELLVTQRLAAAHQSHFRRNIRLTLVLLVVWALVGLGCGVLLADILNQFQFLGSPLGFWFAQQGSIYIFIALIFYYKKRMDDIDRQFDVHED